MISTAMNVRRVRCEPLGGIVELPARPRRVVSLVSGWTEAIWEMGLAERVAGVSEYCVRYVDTHDRVVVGDYLRVNEAMLRELRPDLVLMTGGVQLEVARKLASAGFPVFVLPLPDSYFGVLENIRRLGALLGDMGAAQTLTAKMQARAAALRAGAPARSPAAVIELWCGRHTRMIGGLTFVHDIVELAGYRNVFGGRGEGYLELDREAIAEARPELVVLFREGEGAVVDLAVWRETSGWRGPVIEAGIAKGRSLIHDGPSMLDTAGWLQSELARASRISYVES